MINVGIIGMGRSGWELHAAPLSKFPEYKLVAICDQSEKRRNEASAAFGAQAYTQWQQLVSDPQIQLVVVSTPSHYHVEPTLAALEAGKHVLVEKPMAVTLADAEKMVSAAEKAGNAPGHWENCPVFGQQPVGLHHR